MGLELLPLHWYDRSVLRESLVRALHQPTGSLGAPPASRLRDRIDDAALETFARKRPLVRRHRQCGATTLPMTQPVRIRASHRSGDLTLLECWVHGLNGAAVPGQLERFNEVLRGVGSTARVVDAARDNIDWTDDDFGDAVH